ncbi:lysine N(6)-hydroxylase/L-ornithine N(5)-oxygenase family protein [Trinickia sp. LjRoot230]|uniref:lysine N(6)-hydroxylase/L-ornithine N(5)-oxygenase family protein n=1 Tax=Trinickia sp. LjRoot230 TaxID=3342288 RepID=UPI003ED12FAB
MQRDTVFDLIGVGFGPSNLALAVRLAEQEQQGEAPLTHCFIERQLEFGWHRGMLLDDCRMQISFLKDLATLRDPKSRFTFINYLFERGRLADFVNLKNFFPTRVEFHDYLRWVASSFDERVHYGERVAAIEPVMAAGGSSQINALRVHSADEAGREWHRVTRALSLGLGGAPHVPEMFASLGEAGIVHSSNYLHSIDRLAGAPTDDKRRRVAVIGSGQSAAEVFTDLTRRFEHVDATLVMRAGALKPADDSPFVNEIFSPAFTDVFYGQPRERRDALLADFRDTNYAVVDRPLIEQIYEMLYLQRIEGEARHRLCAHSVIEAAQRTAGGQIELTMRDTLSGRRSAERFDALVLATGYRRDPHRTLLAGLAQHLGDALAAHEVGRDYRLSTPAHFKPRIYLQGCCEDSHGLSDTLLSVLARRSDEIATALREGHTRARGERTNRMDQTTQTTQIAQTKNNGVGDGRMAVAL